MNEMAHALVAPERLQTRAEGVVVSVLLDAVVERVRDLRLEKQLARVLVPEREAHYAPRHVDARLLFVEVVRERLREVRRDAGVARGSPALAVVADEVAERVCNVGDVRFVRRVLFSDDARVLFEDPEQSRELDVVLLLF